MDHTVFHKWLIKQINPNGRKRKLGGEEVEVVGVVKVETIQIEEIKSVTH